jgi:hypothetical protein
MGIVIKSGTTQQVSDSTAVLLIVLHVALVGAGDDVERGWHVRDAECLPVSWKWAR